MVATAVAALVAVPAPDRLVVGDSIAYSARHRLEARGFEVNAVPGRRMAAAPRIVARSGARVVVVELSTNGRLRLRTCVRTVAATSAEVYLVTNTRHAANNRVLRACARRFPGRVRLIRWHRVVAEHPRWLRADGVHLTKAGRRGFAALIDRRTRGESDD